MRKLKVKIWNKKTLSFEEDFNEFYSNQNELYGSPRSNFFEALSDVEDDKDLILIQSIGIQDVNGVEIYEGDIVKNANCFGPVVYQNGSYRIHPVCVLDPKLIYQGSLYWGAVIGNIFENPELLNS